MSTTPNPTETTAGFCQNCGKPLSVEQLRTVGGMVYCEPCLAQRLGVPIPGQTVPPMPGAIYPPAHNSPILAGFLGFIPGVGAMYNGQVAKGLVHVMIFIALIGAADHFGPFGILIAAWVVYQVFDAYQTADALRHGLAVPDYLGLNQIATRLGLTPHRPMPGYSPVAPTTEYPAAAGETYAAGQAPPASGYVAPGFVPPGFVPPAVPMGDYVPPPDPGFTPGLMDEPTHHSFPIGALVLIALGVLFMLGTAGIIGMHWFHHGWPILLIVLGVAIFLRNSNRFRGGPR
jgi:TM2 domain-containing membrane protein YozV